MAIKHKAFIAAMNTFNQDIEAFKNYLADKRLTFQEKKILNCWILLRSKKYEELLKILKEISVQDELIQANQSLLMAIAYNNKSEYHLSNELITKALFLLKKYDLPYFKFQAYFYRFICWYNLGEKKELKKTLKDLVEFKRESPAVYHRILLCEFDYLTYVNEFEEAQIILCRLTELSDQFDDYMNTAFCFSKFCFYFKSNQLESCREELNNLKKFRSFQPSHNYNFSKILLNYLQSDEPIYFEQAIFSSHPFLHLQLQVIKYLSRREMRLAEMAWDELITMAPHLYQEDYKYSGERCLFSVALEKAIGKTFEIKPQFPEVQYSNKILKAKALVDQFDKAIHPSEFFQFIWGREMHDSKDMMVLKKMISRLRENGYDIKFKNGCYHFKKKTA